jgi:hypothetical protein
MRLLGLLLAASLLTACATPIPLNTVKFAGQTSVKSSKEAAVVVLTGAVRGSGTSSIIPVGGVFIPMSTGPIPELQFNAKDQQEFGESLRAELVRLGLLKSVTADDTGRKDLRIRVMFAQTFHNPNGQVYALDVVMEIEGGANPFLKQYRVVSSERDTTWEKLNTNAYQGKEKAAKLLMERLIPDIEQYVAAL